MNDITRAQAAASRNKQRRKALALRLLSEGHSTMWVASHLGVHFKTIYAYRREHRQELGIDLFTERYALYRR